ncbi:MAG TPA: tRNA preQ1(34) S-adenosylmethionine ribosyltransferase-isomerase QueA [Terriglobia bacterium]|jgi:S-adenosylmethionine:tRNA ribosyltransferase-isomerase
MHISDFDYELPPGRIASEPVRPRDASRMMVMDRATGQWIDSAFRRLPEFLNPSDLLVINDTRVIRARVRGRLERASGTAREVEVLFAAPAADNAWEVMCRPGKRVRTGDKIIFAGGELEAVVGESRPHGLRLLHLRSGATSGGLSGFLERHGHIPLPPYMERALYMDTPADAAEYQTIYANVPGAVAAPTAGLHFTNEMFDELKARGIEVVKLTLHVGVGTFIPVRASDPREHVLKPERFELSAESAARLNAARDVGRRLIAVGTTSTRTLEYVFQKYGRFEGASGEADLFILPGYDFKAVDGILTNFHLPRSTLLMLVSAFSSRENILNAYRHAIGEGYRFYSYGDCMLIR